MTIPYERTQAVLRTRDLLNELAAGAPIDEDTLRRRAAALLKHYPGPADINNAAAALPAVWATGTVVWRRVLILDSGLILLAQNREGYGNLSELITLARMRAPKGEYRLTPRDLSRPERDMVQLRGKPDCLAIHVPDFPANEELLDAQLHWLDATFPARAWAGLVLHQRAMNDIHRGSVEYMARRHGIPVVALGNVVMHVRSRKPLQDTMTAIRVGQPVHECGYGRPFRAQC